MLKRAGLLLSAAVILAAGPIFAQRGGMGMGMMPPAMNGVWNPVVGSGATYEMVGKDGKHSMMTVSVVAKEEIEGQSGFWIEYLIPGASSDAPPTVMQMFMVKNGETMSAARMVVQSGNNGPMLISGQMMGMMAARGGTAPPKNVSTDVRAGAESIGAESVTAGAHTFDATHFKTKEGSHVWLSPNAGPWGIVKSTTADTSMTVVNVVTDAKSHVTGTPVSIESMMGRGRGQE